MIWPDYAQCYGWEIITLRKIIRNITRNRLRAVCRNWQTGTDEGGH